MFRISGRFQAHRGKLDLIRLFSAAAIAQALALVVGLWLEQKLIETVINPIDTQAASTSPHHTSTQYQSIPSEAGSGKVIDLVESLPQVHSHPTNLILVKVIVFLWICSSQSIVAYLILSRWNAVTTQRRSADADSIARQNHDLVRTRDAVIFGLAKLAESRDPETGLHLERIAIYAVRLANAMRRDPRFTDRISAAFVKNIEISSALHDIGKVGVEDAILLKPSRLTAEERAKIELHTTIGGDCIQQIENRLGASNFLEMAREIAVCHHERWDGAGYPMGLSREEIPLAARIISIADVYDALSVRRVYKPAYSHEKCVEIIQAGAGSQFDPAIVEIFLQIESDFQRCAEELSDQLPHPVKLNPTNRIRMSPDQERLLSQIDVSEQFCSVDTFVTCASNHEVESVQS